jgi:thermitase
MTIAGPRPFVQIALILLLACFALCNSRATAQGSAPFQEIAVGYRPSAGPPPTVRALGTLGFGLRGHPRSGIYRCRVPATSQLSSVLTALRTDPAVVFAEVNSRVRAFQAPNDPDYSTRQYAPQLIDADGAWSVWQPRTPVVVAVIDSGLDLLHPDLAASIARTSGGMPVQLNVLRPGSEPQDDYGHGSHVSGILGAATNNGRGMAGLATWSPVLADAADFVKMAPIKALDSRGEGTNFDVAEGVLWAVDHGARVINLSLGGDEFSATLEQAVAYAWQQGALVVAAAGNSGRSTPTFPATYANVISVGGTNAADTIASFSSYGSWVQLAAPGDAIWSTWKGRGYQYFSGTSMSTPQVAAAAAMIWAQNPSLTNQQVREILLTQVDPIAPYRGRTFGPGAGRLNLERALRTAGVGAPSLALISAATPGVTSGRSVDLTFRLTAPAGETGAVVVVHSSRPDLVAVPAQVVVQPGQTTAVLSLEAGAVTTPTVVTLGGTYPQDVSRSLRLTVFPPGPRVATVQLSPARLLGGTSGTGKVLLDSPAPAGLIVQLVSSNLELRVPSAVAISAGSQEGTFPFSTSAVLASVKASVIASFADSVGTGATTVVPLLDLVFLSPAEVRGGTRVTATVRLNGPAPNPRLPVSLASSSRFLVVPARLYIKAGATSATVNLATRRVTQPVTADVTVRDAFSSVSARLTLRP